MSDQRLKIIAGNWKMNLLPSQGLKLVKEILQHSKPVGTEVVFIPPYTHLQRISDALKDGLSFSLGAQNCHQEVSGAYTGEVAAAMLKELGVSYVVLGHSERRLFFGENDVLIRKKICAVLSHQMKAIYCCGESEADRISDRHEEVIKEQLSVALDGLDQEQMTQLVIAYEPVWAIGTGKTATPEQACEMHAHIRSVIEKMYSLKIAEGIPILYGGSVNGDNAIDLLSRPGIDGALVGGASLKADEFLKIISATQ